MAQSQPAVVLVEDDDSLRNALAGMLTASGFQVLPFATAEEALSNEPWDAVACAVIDVRLPGMSGLELLRRLRMRENVVPVIVVTADERQSTRDAAIHLGVSAYLAKPVHGHAVVAAVREAVSR